MTWQIKHTILHSPHRCGSRGFNTLRVVARVPACLFSPNGENVFGENGKLLIRKENDFPQTGKAFPQTGKTIARTDKTAAVGEKSIAVTEFIAAVTEKAPAASEESIVVTVFTPAVNEKTVVVSDSATRCGTRATRSRFEKSSWLSSLRSVRPIGRPSC